MKKINIILVLVLLLIISCAAASAAYRVNTNDCVGCNDCVKVCPVNAISIEDGKAYIDQEKCIKCGLCYKACTYEVIRKSK